MASLDGRRRGGYVLALDVGTGSIHCLIADTLARPIALSTGPMRYFTPEGCPPLSKEFRPDDVIEECRGLARRALNEAGAGGDEVLAVSVTSQRQGVVFIDELGDELYAGPNIDLRAVFQGAAIDDERTDEIYRTTGHLPSMLMAPARLQWFRENKAYVYHRVRLVLPLASWLAHRLTGCGVSEPSLDAEAGLMDVALRSRCPELMDILGVAPGILAPTVPAGEPAGHLSEDVAQAWGLRVGVPVFIAGPDTQCGLLGMGLTKEGGAGAVLGWSGAVQVLTPQPSFDYGMRTWVGITPTGGQWVSEANLGDSGNVFGWLKDLLLGTDTPFQRADTVAAEASSSGNGVVALLGPGPSPPWKAGLRTGGLLFPIPLTFQRAGAGELLRAAMENIAFALKANLATLEEVTGVGGRELSLGGGMSRSVVQARIIAGVLGCPVRRSTFAQASARGAALVACTASEWGGDQAEAMELALRDCEVVDPGTGSEVAEYQELYQEWMELYQRLAQTATVGKTALR